MRVTYLLILCVGFSCSSKNPASEAELGVSSTQKEGNTDLQQADPQIALDFINAYLANDNSDHQRMEIREWVSQNALVTDQFKVELVDLISKAWERDPEYGLGYDPILMAQDSPEQFELSAFNAENGLVRVNGVRWKDFDLSLKVVLVDGKTYVDGCGEINMEPQYQVER